MQKRTGQVHHDIKTFELKFYVAPELAFDSVFRSLFYFRHYSSYPLCFELLLSHFSCFWSNTRKILSCSFSGLNDWQKQMDPALLQPVEKHIIRLTSIAVCSFHCDDFPSLNPQVFLHGAQCRRWCLLAFAHSLHNASRSQSLSSCLRRMYSCDVRVPRLFFFTTIE